MSYPGHRVGLSTELDVQVGDGVGVQKKFRNKTFDLIITCMPHNGLNKFFIGLECMLGFGEYDDCFLCKIVDGTLSYQYLYIWKVEKDKCSENSLFLFYIFTH